MTSGERPSGTFAWRAGFVLVVLVTAFMSLVAYADGLPEFVSRSPVDKMVHFTFAGMLTLTLDGALGKRDVDIAGRAMPLAPIVVLVPSGIEEFLQRFSSHRTSSIWDFAADCAGAAVFAWLSRRAVRRAQARV